MKKIKYLLYAFIVLVVILCTSFGILKLIKTNAEVENSLSTEYIQDEKIKAGFESEKQRIKQDEQKKFIIGELIVLVICVTGAIIVDKKIK